MNEWCLRTMTGSTVWPLYAEDVHKVFLDYQRHYALSLMVCTRYDQYNKVRDGSRKLLSLSCLNLQRKWWWGNMSVIYLWVIVWGGRGTRCRVREAGTLPPPGLGVQDGSASAKEFTPICIPIPSRLVSSRSPRWKQKQWHWFPTGSLHKIYR